MEWTVAEHVLNGVIIVLTIYMLIRAVLARIFPRDR
jgi:hypothetical protein